MTQKLEYWWRHWIAYPFLRLMFHNPRIDSAIDINTTKNLLLLRYDRIGDMIVTTPIFRSLKQLNPSIRIGVFASTANADIIRYNPYVDSVYVLHTNWLKLLAEVRKARKEHYEVVLNLIFNRTTSGGILANLVSPSGIKIGQGDDKYRFYFNRLLKISRANRHMIETFVYIINEVFNIRLRPDQMHYEIFIDDRTRGEVRNYLHKNNLSSRDHIEPGSTPYLVFNLSANDAVRRISAEQAYAIGKYLGHKIKYKTVIFQAPDDSIMLDVKKDLVENFNCLAFPEHGNATLLELASLIEGAVAVVTPDTSIIHFAAAVSTPVIGFYTQMQDIHEWLPHLVKYKVVTSSEHEPTNTIPTMEMLQAIDAFIEEIEELTVSN
jgi:ADP-heptose:LPS heptosyltransferase